MRKFSEEDHLGLFREEIFLPHTHTHMHAPIDTITLVATPISITVTSTVEFTH